MGAFDRFEVPGATRHDWILDGVLTGVFALSALPYLGYMSGGVAEALAWVLANLLMVAPLVLRRHYPLLMLAGATLAGLVQVLVSPYPMLSIAVVPVIAYSVARWVSGRISRSVVYVGLFGAILGPTRWLFVTESMASSDVPGRLVAWVLAALVCIGLVVTPYAIGRRVRETALAREANVAAAAERYQMLITEREQRARMAEAQTRATIARELHDIVAHSLSVMIVQAEGGRALAAKKPEAALQALDTIADTGREALAEARRIVSVLRDGPEAQGPAEYAPTPGLDDIPDLVRRTSDRAELVVLGDPPRVSQTLGLTAYRIVQEALTNFLKHAGPAAHARVTLRYSPSLVNLEVVDDGRGTAVHNDGQGNGLRGMHERVGAMGGRLVAQPHPGGGFLVQAMLPVHLPGQSPVQPAPSAPPHVATMPPERWPAA